MSIRLGPGKFKHIDIRALWIQQEVRSQRVVLHKLLTTDNSADALTKVVKDPELHEKLIKKLGVHLEETMEGEKRKQVSGPSLEEAAIRMLTLLSCVAGGE